MENKKNVLTIMAIIVGMTSILLGLYFIVFVAEDDGFIKTNDGLGGYITKLGTSTFGADFYTDIYQATAFAGNAISAIYHILCYGMGAFFTMGGIIDICYFAPKLSRKSIRSSME